MSSNPLVVIEPDLAAVVRDQSIGGDRAAVLEETRADRAIRSSPRRAAPAASSHGVHDTARKIVGSGRGLGRPHFAGTASTRPRPVNVPPVSTPIMYCAFDAMPSFPFCTTNCKCFRSSRKFPDQFTSNCSTTEITRPQRRPGAPIGVIEFLTLKCRTLRSAVFCVILPRFWSLL